MLKYALLLVVIAASTATLAAPCQFTALTFAVEHFHTEDEAQAECDRLVKILKDEPKDVCSVKAEYNSGFRAVVEISTLTQSGNVLQAMIDLQKQVQTHNLFGDPVLAMQITTEGNCGT